jgi:hypothetical protein
MLGLFIYNKHESKPMPMLLPPFDQDTPLYRGNLHGHSNLSDGQKTCAEVINAYQGLGYDFIAISDHLWDDPSFASTTVTDASDMDSADFITIPSAELHCLGKRYDQDGLWHIVANGLPLDFKTASREETITTLIARAREAGAYVSIAHPEWHGVTTDEALMASSADAVEVFNYSAAIECGRGLGIGTADILLHEGKRISFTATDDSHFRSQDFGGGWIMVGADDLTPSSLVNAIKDGRHYSSTGAEIHALLMEGDELHVACSPANHIVVSGIGYAALSAHGNNMTYADFDLNDLASPYFRVTVIGTNGQMAWSNPFWLDQLR